MGFTSENHPTAEEVSASYSFKDKTALVTGANTGIGKETARVLALRGCHVIMCCRSAQKGEEARRDLLQSLGEGAGPLLEVAELDLSSLAGVREFAQRFGRGGRRPIHLLINNAGVMAPRQAMTPDGLESHFGVNHLGHFLLTLLLLPHLRAAAPARIVMVSSEAHRFAPPDLTPESLPSLARQAPEQGPEQGGNPAYGLSKLCNILFAKELAGRLEGTGITCTSLHPGMIVTELARDLDPAEFGQQVQLLSSRFNVPILSVAQGAATTLFAAGSKEGSTPGAYFSECAIARPSRLASSPELAKALWSLSEDLASPRWSKL